MANQVVTLKYGIPTKFQVGERVRKIGCQKSGIVRAVTFVDRDKPAIYRVEGDLQGSFYGDTMVLA